MVLGGCLFQPFPGSFQVFFHAESVQADDSHVVLLGGVAGIFYDIDTLNRVVESGKNHAWLLCLREDGTCLHDISFHRNELDGIEFDNFVYDGCGIEEYIQFWRLSCIDGDVELKRVYLTKQWRTRVQNEQMDQCK